MYNLSSSPAESEQAYAVRDSEPILGTSKSENGKTPSPSYQSGGHPAGGTKSSQHKSKPPMLRNWSTDYYSGDSFPTHWSEERVKLATEKYPAMPEEYYTTTGYPVVTPDNFEKFLEAHRDYHVRWDLQERCSGSGRLSASAHKQMCVCR